MTIGNQNAINAQYIRPQESQPGIVHVPVRLSPDIAAKVVHYLDAHPGESWDAVVEAALEKFLSTTV